MARDTRARMIETTARLLQHRGYYGTSLSDILAASEAPRGSLYFHFPGGKDQLVIEATRAAVELATTELCRTLAAASGPGAAARAYAEAAARLMEASGYTFGCPVAPVILDAAGGLDELEALCRATFARWTGLFRDALAAAGMGAVRAEAMALVIVAAIEGALLLARARRDCTPMLQIAAELEVLVNAALVAETPPARPPKAGKARKRAKHGGAA